MHAAAAFDYADVVALLLQYGTNKDTRDEDGRTPVNCSGRNVVAVFEAWDAGTLPFQIERRAMKRYVDQRLIQDLNPLFCNFVATNVCVHISK